MKKIVFIKKYALVAMLVAASFIVQYSFLQTDFRYVNASDIAEEETLIDSISPVVPEESAEYYYRNGMVSAGLYHSILLNEKGKVFTWGDNSFGQLGIGPGETAESPTEVFGLSDVVAVSAGAYHSIALTADGNIFAWGRNSFGQIGNGSTETVFVPTRVSGIPPVKDISAGAYHSLAVDINGRLFGWGNNTDGQTGDVPSDEIMDESQNFLGLRVTKPEIVIEENVSRVSAGGFHSVALMNDGGVYTWGNNDYGQLGDGSTVSRNIPEKTLVLNSVVSISAGYNHNFAIVQLPLEINTDDEFTDYEYYRSLYAWGGNQAGQLGLGMLPDNEDYVTSPRRVDVTGNPHMENDRVSKADAGYFHSVATVKDDNETDFRDNVYVWGNNSYGQLGIGEMPSQNAPVKLKGSSNGWTGDSFLPFQSVSAGGYHTLLLSVKGFMGSMGRADRGQLGNVSVIESNIPVGIPVYDAISPEWTSDSYVTATRVQESLYLSWEEAGDNIGLNGYEIRYINVSGEAVISYVENTVSGDPIEYVTEDIDINGSQLISVFAVDNSGNKSLYPLIYRLNMPSENDEQQRYFQNNENQRITWSPYYFAEINTLEVPWDVDYIYGTGVVMPPRDYSWLIAIIITVVVTVFFTASGILAFKKNHKDIRIFGDIIRVRKPFKKSGNDKIDNPEYNDKDENTDNEKSEYESELEIEINDQDKIGFEKKESWLKKMFGKNKENN